MAIQVTIEIPHYFIRMVEGTEVWKEEAAGYVWAEEAHKRFFKEFLDSTGMLAGGMDHESVYEWVNDNTDTLFDIIYESSMERY